MYTSIDFPSKKAFKDAVKSGKKKLRCSLRDWGLQSITGLSTSRVRITRNLIAGAGTPVFLW
jgi:hypothetical protein